VNASIVPPVRPSLGEQPVEGVVTRAARQPRRLRFRLLPDVKLITWLFSLATRAVLLAILLGVFGFLTLFAYFLVGRTWSMPVVLSAGHEQVIKAQHDWMDTNLKLADIEGRLHGLRRQLLETENSLEIARIAVAAEVNTIRTEAKQNDLEIKSIENTTAKAIAARTDAANLLLRIARLPDPEENFERRLVNRARFLTDMLARTDLGIKVAALDASLAENATHRTALEERRDSLRSAQAIMQGKSGEGLSAPELDDVKTWNQAVLSLRIGTDEVQRLRQELEKLDALRTEMLDSLRPLAASPLLKAARMPAVVIFVPYGNATTYKPGQPLYHCRLWLALCSSIGTIGPLVDGETTSSHPYFHSVSRGSFYTVELTGNTQAAEDSLLFSAPPLLF